MELYETPHPLSDYFGQTFECSCGRMHSAPLKAVAIGPGTLVQLSELLKNLGYHTPYLICDETTYKVAGKRCLEILADAKIHGALRVLTHIKFDEATLGELMIHMPDHCDLCIAVGTGAINDTVRYFSYHMNLPFLTIATAAPMDGFASSIAALNVDTMKTTFPAQPPVAIVGDTDILCKAPYRMMAAGLGDLLGKYTCLCDWKLSALITGEHRCERISNLVYSCTDRVLKNAENIRNREHQAVGFLMEGLVTAGVAISLYGNSRPASGCEHHISHYWEMIFEQEGKPPVPHGIQVGVGTILILKLAEQLRAQTVDFRKAERAAGEYSQANWEAEMKRVYGTAANSIIELEHTAQKNESSVRIHRIQIMEQHWDEICAILSTLPSSVEIAALLRSLNAPCTPSEIGISNVCLKNTLMYCKEVRNRYTLLQMLWDLDLLDALSNKVIAAIHS